MNVRLKRAKELAGYAVQLTKEEGLPTMVKRGAGFVKRRCFGKRARYLPAKKVLEAQRAEMAGKTAADCGLPTISVLTPLYNTPEKYLREFLDSFVGQTAPNGQLCLADASDAAHGDVERIVKEYQQKNQQTPVFIIIFTVLYLSFIFQISSSKNSLISSTIFCGSCSFSMYSFAQFPISSHY